MVDPDLRFNCKESLVKSREIQAKGNRNKKYTIERSTLEFIQPKPNASLNQAHSILKAIFGKKIQTTPIQAEAI